MKIVRRDSYIHPASTSLLWVIPSVSYLLQKVIGLEFNEREYVWWIAIPAVFTFWFLLNFCLFNEAKRFSIYQKKFSF